jgi:hypothetical protein
MGGVVLDIVDTGLLARQPKLLQIKLKTNQLTLEET